MAYTLASFIVDYPEFEEADAALVEGKLAMATRRVDAVAWGDQFDDGVGLLAAHLLAISPFGQMARMSATDGTSTYLKSYEAARDEVTFGLGRVL